MWRAAWTLGHVARGQAGLVPGPGWHGGVPLQTLARVIAAGHDLSRAAAPDRDTGRKSPARIADSDGIYMRSSPYFGFVHDNRKRAVTALPVGRPPVGTFT